MAIHPVDTYIGNKLKMRRAEMGIIQDTLGKLIGLIFQQLQKKQKKKKHRKSTKETADMTNLEKIFKEFNAQNPIKSSQETQIFLKRYTDFGYDANEEILQDLKDEINELTVELRLNNVENVERIKSELGDVVFVICQLANIHNIDLEECLNISNHEYQRRFIYIENKVGKDKFKSEIKNNFKQLWGEAKETKEKTTIPELQTPTPLQANLWNQIKSQTFKAHIADIDGNLTPTEGKYETVSKEVIDSIREKLLRGIPFGICSARSLRPKMIMENIRNEVIKNLPDEALKYFYLFPEQGSKVIWYGRNKNNSSELIPHETNLAKFFNLVHQSMDRIGDEERNRIFKIISEELEQKHKHPIIELKSKKDYGFQATVVRQDNMNDYTYTQHVKTITREANRILKNLNNKSPIEFNRADNNDKNTSSNNNNSNNLEYEAFCTRTAIYVAIKDINKELPLKFISEIYSIKKEEIITTDDQCDETGVGYSLTRHFGGISTNYRDKSSKTQLNISRIYGKTGVEAWLFLDGNIKYEAPENMADSYREAQENQIKQIE